MFKYLTIFFIFTISINAKDIAIYFQNSENFNITNKKKISSTIEEELKNHNFSLKSEEKVKTGISEIFDKYLIKEENPKFLAELGDELKLDNIILIKKEVEKKNILLTLQILNVKNRNIKNKLLIFKENTPFDFFLIKSSTKELLDDNWKERIALEVNTLGNSKESNNFLELLKNKTSEVLTLSNYQVDTKNIFKTAYKLEIVVSGLNITYKLFNVQEQQVKTIQKKYLYDKTSHQRVEELTVSAMKSMLNIQPNTIKLSKKKKVFIKGNFLQYKFSDSLKNGIENRLIKSNLQIVKSEKDSDEVFIITIDDIDSKPYSFKIELFNRSEDVIENSYTIYYNNELTDHISLKNFGEQLVLTLNGEIEAPSQHYLSFLNISPTFTTNYLLFEDTNKQVLFFLGVEVNLIFWKYRSLFISALGGGIAIGNSSYLSYWINAITIGVDMNNFKISIKGQYKKIKNDQNDQVTLFATAEIGYFINLFEQSGLYLHTLVSYGKSNHANINKQAGLLLGGGISFDYHF